MCGICGKINFKKSDKVEKRIIKSMMDVMHHRGPDDEGTYINGNIGLGHKRLTIIDLSSGKQPISNENDTIWIVFNGEIYNYQELRISLLAKGHKFKTNTDTEVIVHLYEEYGDNFVNHLRGMFALCIWDSNVDKLILTRDRVGIKPLYYFHNANSLWFASELKSILQDKSVERNINYSAVDKFLTFYYVPGNETLISGLKKLEPGHYLISKNGQLNIKEYWDLNFSSPDKVYPEKEYLDQLDSILSESVRLHLLSDVPVGVLLSGGIDSTALLSYMREQSDKEISSFTIGFPYGGFADERYFAKIAADKFGSKHYDLTITSEDFFNFLPDYVWHMEEPVCEPPAIALYYVTKLAKDYVKVLISGEGGDEAFAGYQTYRNLIWLEKIKNNVKTKNGRKIIGHFFNRINRLKKYTPLLDTNFDAYYYSRTSNPFSYFNQIKESLYTEEFKSHLRTEKYVHYEKIKDYDLLNKMLYIDSKTWLPDDLLVKADKMTMANSVELRVPLLDHKVLEFAASLPQKLKLKRVTTKYLLKKLFNNKIPQEILKRKKTGLPIPYASWLNQKKSRQYINEIIFDSSSFSKKYFNSDVLLKELSGNTIIEQPKALFSLLTLEMWYNAFIKNPN